MRIPVGLLVMIASIPIASAADLEAGKAKAATVCAACHGALGVSVSDTIPNLRARRRDISSCSSTRSRTGAARMR